MVEVTFKGVFEQGDGIGCLSEVKLTFVEDSIEGTDKSEYGEWQIRALLGQGDNIVGVYNKIGSDEVSGRFTLFKTENGYEGEYSGNMDDDSRFTGYYKWLRK